MRVVSSEAIHRIVRRGRVDSLDLLELAGEDIDIDDDDDKQQDENEDNEQDDDHHEVLFHDHSDDDDAAVVTTAEAEASRAATYNNVNNYNKTVQFGPWRSQNNDNDDDCLLSMICPRRQLNSPDVAARLVNWNNNDSNHNNPPSIQELFETFFPADWLRNMLLVQTNHQLIVVRQQQQQPPQPQPQIISYGEMLRFLGLLFLHATTHFDDVNDFWNTSATTAAMDDDDDDDDNRRGNNNVDDPFGRVPRIFMQLDAIMSHDRFFEIYNALQYTTDDIDEGSDDDDDDAFWPVRQMLQAWNDNMSAQFMSSWISCLDITTSPWIVPAAVHDDEHEHDHTAYRLCPGFKCVPRMPSTAALLLGNKYHVICCGTTGILYRLELDEGQDGPPTISAAANAEVVQKEFSSQGKTVGTWLRLAKPLFGSAKVVVLGHNMMSLSPCASTATHRSTNNTTDCMVQGLMELRKRGVFGTALIQKRPVGQSFSSYPSLSISSWPKHICGNDIIFHFADKDVGYADSLPGTFRGQSFHVACTKERPLPNHHHHHHHLDDSSNQHHITSSNCDICSSSTTSSNVTMLLSTYGTMERGGETKTRHYQVDDETNNGTFTTKRTKTFQYPLIIQNHIQYQDKVESHTHSRMLPISLEAEGSKSTTTTWPNRVFQFLLAVTEVNCRLAMETLFCNGNNGQRKKKYSQQEFRKLLAKSLIHNTHLDVPVTVTTNRRNTNHEQQQQQRQKRQQHGDDAPSTSIQERRSAETATASKCYDQQGQCASTATNSPLPNLSR
jgi:Transposase IS4